MPQGNSRNPIRGYVFWADDDFAPDRCGKKGRRARVTRVEKEGYTVITEYRPNPKVLCRWIKDSARAPRDRPKFLVLDQMWPGPPPLGEKGGWNLYKSNRNLILNGFYGVVFFTKNPTPELEALIAHERATQAPQIRAQHALVDGPGGLVRILDQWVKRWKQWKSEQEEGAKGSTK